jgi:penicillin-binding protein 1A
MNVPDIGDQRDKVTEPQRAYQIVSILEGAVQRGTGVRMRNIGFPVAGKTGTTNNAKDAWFIGFTPDLVFGAYVGFDQPRPLGRKETGSSAALPIIQQFLEEASAEGLIDPLPFRVPSGVSMIQVNADTGRRAFPGEGNVIWEAFMSGESPDRQETIYGGETITFDEPEIDFNDLFYNVPSNDNNGFGNDAAIDNGNPFINDNRQQRPNNDTTPLQGTGGIY